MFWYTVWCAISKGRVKMGQQKQLSPEIEKKLNALEFHASLNFRLGPASKAEPLYREILAIYEEHFGLDAPEVAATLNKLADVLANAKHYDEAEKQIGRASCRERV